MCFDLSDTLLLIEVVKKGFERYAQSLVVYTPCRLPHTKAWSCGKT